MGRQLAILHYHLNRGGVTQVIRNHLLALQACGCRFDSITLMHGGRGDAGLSDNPPTFPGLRVQTRVIPELDYDAIHGGVRDPAARVGQLSAAIESTLFDRGATREGTILHVHNHALGKNSALPGCVGELARRGFRCLLQIHDFIEDARPANYQHLCEALGGPAPEAWSGLLYPQAAHLHYAVLNGRDRQILSAAGVAPARLHYLPNPVAGVGELPERVAARRKLDPALDASRRLILYPVRGIRRKLVGELLLWAALFRESCSFALSLAPQNPVEQPHYERIVNLARELELPVYFNTGGQGGLSFAENVAAADALLTTSVAEGFGMVFLESWLAQRPLVGRDLPEITCDFRDAGVDLETLLPRFDIPLDWLGREAVLEPLRNAARELYRGYRTPLPPDPDFESQLAALLTPQGVDFARLSFKLQAAVVRRVARVGASARRELCQLNPGWAEMAQATLESQRERVRSNASRIQTAFGLRAIGQRLNAVYDDLARCPANSPVSRLARPEAILAGFLELSRLYPIRFARPDA